MIDLQSGCKGVKWLELVGGGSVIRQPDTPEAWKVRRAPVFQGFVLDNGGSSTTVDECWVGEMLV